MTKTLRLAFAAPLALALAACGSDAGTGGDIAELKGEPIAPIAAPAGTQWRDKVTVTKYNGYLVGNPDAPIKVVEYGSLTCPTCARFSVEGSEPLLANYVNKGTVSFELRNFAVHGTVDVVLARMARCGAPEAVLPLSDQLWANQQAVVAPVQSNAAQIDAAMNLPMNQRFVAFAEIANFYDFFAQRGISEDQARSCLADVKAMDQLANDTRDQGQEFNVQGTPTFFVNGKNAGVNSWAGLEAILQRAGAR